MSHQTWFQKGRTLPGFRVLVSDESRSTCPPTSVVLPHLMTWKSWLWSDLGFQFSSYITSGPNNVANRRGVGFFSHLTFTTYGDIMITRSKFSTKYNERQLCLISYLENQVKSGQNFFKSKYIAKETGLSPKEVGTNMGILAEICPKFRIERYSYSNSTTWLITPQGIPCRS